MFQTISRSLSNFFSRISGESKLTEESIKGACTEMFDILLQADVPYEVAESFLAGVKSRAMNEQVHARLKAGDHFIKIVYEQLVELLGGNQQPFTFKAPSVVLLLGLQGAGKTTMAGKIAAHAMKSDVKRILLASVDFNRPAAIDQLEQLAGKVSCDFYRTASTNPIDAAREIKHEYEAKKYDLLILDTAGRLHVDEPLLDELKEIAGMLENPYKFLVLDAMTGQQSLAIGKAFESVGYTGVLLTKMDGSAKAGAAISIRHQFKKPILFMGTGEKIDDLELFHPDRVARRIIGLGDILSLIEKAETALREEEKARAAATINSGHITLEDFAQQITMLNSMGPISSLARYMPGGQSVSDEQLARVEKELKGYKAIISSMTRKERLRPELLNGQRKMRIAKGSGTTPAEVNALLTRFEESKKMVKLLKLYNKYK